MPRAHSELIASLDDLKAEVGFVAIASQLRPRIGEVIDWQKQPHALEMAKRFMAMRSFRQETVYGGLLVRALAFFERYLRRAIEFAVDKRAKAAAKFDNLPEVIAKKNLVLTARLLAAIDVPRDHISIDAVALIDNLATCKPGNSNFKLNALAFYSGISGVTPVNVEKALESLDIAGVWDGLGGDQKLADSLSTKGARATGIRARDRLSELCRLRNQLAHGGDAEPTVDEAQIVEAIDFLSLFSTALDSYLRQQLGT